MLGCCQIVDCYIIETITNYRLCKISITVGSFIDFHSVPRFKRRYALLVPPVGNTEATLDAAKVSTTVLFVASATESDAAPRSQIIDDWGEEIIVACLAQGLPTTIVALSNLENVHTKVKITF